MNSTTKKKKKKSPTIACQRERPLGVQNSRIDMEVRLEPLLEAKYGISDTLELAIDTI